MSSENAMASLSIGPCEAGATPIHSGGKLLYRSKSTPLGELSTVDASSLQKSTTIALSVFQGEAMVGTEPSRFLSSGDGGLGLLEYRGGSSLYLRSFSQAGKEERKPVMLSGPIEPDSLVPWAIGATEWDEDSELHSLPPLIPAGKQHAVPGELSSYPSRALSTGGGDQLVAFLSSEGDIQPNP